MAKGAAIPPCRIAPDLGPGERRSERPRGHTQPQARARAHQSESGEEISGGERRRHRRAPTFLVEVVVLLHDERLRHGRGCCRGGGARAGKAPEPGGAGGGEAAERGVRGERWPRWIRSDEGRGGGGGAGAYRSRDGEAGGMDLNLVWQRKEKSTSLPGVVEERSFPSDAIQPWTPTR